MGTKEAVKKIEEMPKRARETTRGLIPTRRGYALRVCKEAEQEITSHLNPAEATRLGLAMGIRPKSAWVIKGVPGYADTGMIVKTIAQSNVSWPGWIVRPRRPLTASRGKVTTWLVDAMVEPPSTVITLNGYIINIEKYVEALATGRRAAAWHSIKPKLTHEITPGQIYEDEDDAATTKTSAEEEKACQSEKKPVEQKPKKADVIMQPVESLEVRITKRKVHDANEKAAEKDEADKKAEEKDALIHKLLQRLEQKDDQIAAMLTQIGQLQTKLDALSELMMKSQKEAASATDDSNSSDL